MKNVNINRINHVNDEPNSNSSIAGLIAEDNTRLDSLVEQNMFLNQRLKARLNETQKRQSFILKLNLKLLGRTVVTAMGLAFFIFVHSLWIDKVSEKTQTKKTSHTVTEWEQPTPVKTIHQAYSEVLEWEKQEK